MSDERKTRGERRHWRALEAIAPPKCLPTARREHGIRVAITSESVTRKLDFDGCDMHPERRAKTVVLRLFISGIIAGRMSSEQPDAITPSNIE